MGTKYKKISSHGLNCKNNISSDSNNNNNVTSTSCLLIVALIALIAFVMLIITLTSITDVFTDKTQQVPAMLIKTPTKSKDIVVGDNSAGAPPQSNSVLTVTATRSSYTNNKSYGNEVVNVTARGDNFELFSADGHNRFYDKINTSNKRNEFDSIPRRNLTTKSISSTESLYFEGVELQESLLPSYHKQLLPHRNKRYLLFPESSSFQLIFDLIIGIVDYSSYAILGITCAVAWELPSKPPSEILEDIQLKLNDGTLGISRRKDSTQQTLEYVETQAAVNEIQNANKAKVSATVDAGGVRTAEAIATVHEKSYRKPMVTASGYNYNFNNHDYEPLSRKPSVEGMGASHTLATHRNGYRPYNYFYAGDNFGNYDGGVGAKSGSKTFRPAYAQQLDTRSYDNRNNRNNNNSYVENHNGVTRTSSYLNGERKKFVDWNRKAAWYEHKYKYLQQQPQQQQHQQPPAKYAIRNNYANNNWWQHNKQRVQSTWLQKQQQWKQDGKQQSVSQLPSHIATPTNAPMQTAQRTARTRQILQATPKHRIYPVFGKRRRRRNDDAINEFELKMEQVHRRQHLQTRQKLYGKIEKLFKVRGHNGTECVMRALCETAARCQHDAPQSFISELLRAIFTMPRDLQQHEAEANELPAHYREAHAVAADCAIRYALCVHSIWSDLEFGMKL